MMLLMKKTPIHFLKK